MIINELPCRYGKTQGNLISFTYSKGDEFFYNGTSKFQFFPSKRPDLIENLLATLEQNAARQAFLSFVGPKKNHELKGGEPLLAILLVLLKINGVSDKDIASTLSLDEEGISSVIKALELGHDDLETYFEHIGLEQSIYLFLANMLGRYETSAGALLISDKGRVLVEHMTLGHYSIPKGHVEDCDASLVDTAKREIKEELGLEAKINPDIHTSIFYSPKDGVVKEVIFYLGEVVEGPLTLQKEEVSDAYFLEPEDALRVLSYNSDRETLQKLYKEYRKAK